MHMNQIPLLQQAYLIFKDIFTVMEFSLFILLRNKTKIIIYLWYYSQNSLPSEEFTSPFFE